MASDDETTAALSSLLAAHPALVAYRAELFAALANAREAGRAEMRDALHRLLPHARDPNAEDRFDDTCTDCGAMVGSGEGCEPTEAFCLCWPCATERLESLTYAIRALPIPAPAPNTKEPRE